MDLLWRKVNSNLGHSPDDFLDKGFALPWLNRNKVSLALIGNLDESVASHVLDTYRVLAARW